MAYNRSTVISSLLAAARDAEAVLALWESGSEVFGRTDEYSDIDVEALVAPGQLQAVASLVRSAISAVAPISHEYQPQVDQTDVQFFWQCHGVPALNYIDMTLMDTVPAHDDPAID